VQNIAIDPISQFKIKKIFSVNLFGLDISVTNSTIMMITACIVVFIMGWIFHKKKSIIPGKFQSLVEIFYIFIQKLCKENMRDSARYESLIATIFLYIFLGNLLGMIPFCFTFTSQITVTFFLGVFIFCTSVVLGIISHGFQFFRHFIPEGAPLYIIPLLLPIEVISFLSRPFSLGIRLFANMVAGHAMIKVFASFALILGAFFGILPFSINVVLTGFEMIVAFLQSYIFAVLSCIYIAEAIDLH
jgi:F-type H+-transporting ATPase subunit a